MRSSQVNFVFAETLKHKPRLAKFFYRLFSLILLIFLWWMISMAYNFMPSPYEVAVISWRNITDGLVWPHFSATFVRIISALFFSMLIGLLVGIPMGLSNKVEMCLDLWVLAGVMIPATSYGVVLLIIFGLNNFAAITAIILTTSPIMIISIWKGIKSIDNRLNDMARAFKMPKGLRLWRVIIPQLYPTLMGTLRYGIGVIWKITVVIELLALTNGVGYMLMYWFSFFRMGQVLSWTLMFTLFVLLFEWVVLSTLERKLLGWQEQARL